MYYYYGYHKYRYGYRYYEGMRKLRSMKSLPGLDKYYDEISEEIKKLKVVKDKNQPIFKKMYDIDNEIESIQHQINDIKREPSNKAPIRLLLKEEYRNKVADLKKKKRSLNTESFKLSYDLSITKEEYHSIIDGIRDFEMLSIKILVKSVKLEKEKEKKERNKAIIASYEGKSRKLAQSIKKQLNTFSRCPYCGNDIGNDPQADHIYPLSKGGQSTQENMIYVCKSCNIKKQGLTLREFINKYKLDRDFIEKNLEVLGKSF
jgi:DNA repair exonuclease SbcCD ATPase subunit